MDLSAIIIQTVLEARKILTLYILCMLKKKLIQSIKWACAHQVFVRPQVVHRKTRRLVLNWMLANTLGSSEFFVVFLSFVLNQHFYAKKLVLKTSGSFFSNCHFSIHDKSTIESLFNLKFCTKLVS